MARQGLYGLSDIKLGMPDIEVLQGCTYSYPINQYRAECRSFTMKNVTIYTKGYCPYCNGAKQILRAKGIDFKEIDVEFDAGNRREMIKRSGRMTVPQIFF